MANQRAARVLAVIKREAVYGTAEATGTGAEQIRLLDSPGLKFTRGEVPSEERRVDLLEEVIELGGHAVDGSYNTEVNPGGYFDLLMAASVRGTPAALASVPTISADTQLIKVFPDATPTDYGHTVEQRDIDIDESELFYGVRVIKTDFSFQPRMRAKTSFTMKGLSRTLIAAGASPYFTSPNLETGASLIVDSATITYDGSAITTLTGLDFTLDVSAATQDVIGSLINADIYTDMLKVSGTLSAIRQSLAALTAFDAGTEFAIKAILTAPGTGARLTFAVNMPRVKIYDIDAPFLGGDTTKVETRTFKAFAPLGATNVIELYSSTATPTAVA